MRRVLFLFLFLPLLVAACGDDAGSPASHADGHGESSHVAPGARVIEVRGTSFRFDPDAITARVGEELAIELTADDAEHDFVIDELDAHVSASDGRTAVGGFDTGDEARTYVYYCSVAGHRDAGMEGRLVVE